MLSLKLGKQNNIENTKPKITTWLKSLQKNTLIAAYLKLSTSVSQVNPVHIKSFIKSFGDKAQKASIDARYIAKFATKRLQKTLDKSWLQTHEHAELQLRIDYLVTENTGRKFSLDKYKNKSIVADIKREIAATKPY